MSAKFETIDYILLLATLLLSIAIGLYHAVFKKQNTPKEYLHGGKNMSPILVGLSIVSSIMSGIVMTIVPADTYYYGMQYGILNVPGIILANMVSYFWIIPIFFKLQITSIHKYLELRFDAKVKKLSSIIYTIQIILTTPIILYVSSLVLAQVTNVNINIVILVTCLTSITYTVFGGIKAVVWTDALQFCIMLGTVVTIAVISTISGGGLINTFSIAYKTGRINMDFNMDVTKRDTFWSILTSVTSRALASNGLGQGTVQKFLSLRNRQDIKLYDLKIKETEDEITLTDNNSFRAHTLSSAGWCMMCILAVLNGMTLLSRYIFCDPIAAQNIKKPDELVIYAVRDVATDFPGLLGLFVAGIVSGGISFSANLNSSAATLFNDFLKNALPDGLTKKYETNILKTIVLFIGIFCTALTFTVVHLGNIHPLAVSMWSATEGPLVGLFVAGLFMPIGALYGGWISLVIMVCFTISAQWYKMKSNFKYPTLPVYTTGCNVTAVEILTTTNGSIWTNNVDVHLIFQISPYWYQAIATIIVVMVAFIVSYLTRDESPQVRDDYLSPLIHYCRSKMGSKYTSVDTALRTNTVWI